MTRPRVVSLAGASDAAIGACRFGEGGRAGLARRAYATRAGRVAASPTAGSVGLGDLMAIWTNNRWVSNPHRVINPPKMHRYSMPLFVTPPFDAAIACLPTCLGPDEQPTYQSQGAGSYLLSRLDATHSYRNPLLVSSAQQQ